MRANSVPRTRIYSTAVIRVGVHYLIYLWSPLSYLDEQGLILKLRTSSIGPASPRVPASPSKASPRVQKVGLFPALEKVLFWTDLFLDNLLNYIPRQLELILKLNVLHLMDVQLNVSYGSLVAIPCTCLQDISCVSCFAL